MTTQDYYNLLPDALGWRTLPNGNRFRIGIGANIGDSANIGKYANIGDWAIIGDGATIGDYATIGNSANIGIGTKIGRMSRIGDYANISYGDIIGDEVIIGIGAKIGDRANIGNNAIIGNYARIGNSANIGDETKIGDGADIGAGDTTEQLNKYFISTYPEVSVFWKWVTVDLTSPGWGDATPIKYGIGKVVEQPDAIISEHQCGVGLHVFRQGIRPEFSGMCEANHKLVCLEVKVKREDICFGGLPGNDMKLRVKKLRVLRKISS